MWQCIRFEGHEDQYYFIYARRITWLTNSDTEEKNVRFLQVVGKSPYVTFHCGTVIDILQTDAEKAVLGIVFRNLCSPIVNKICLKKYDNDKCSSDGCHQHNDCVYKLSQINNAWFIDECVTLKISFALSCKKERRQNYMCSCRSLRFPRRWQVDT